MIPWVTAAGPQMHQRRPRGFTQAACICILHQGFILQFGRDEAEAHSRQYDFPSVAKAHKCHGLCIDYAGSCLDYAWIVLGQCLDSAWIVRGLRKDYEWIMHGIQMEYTWNIPVPIHPHMYGIHESVHKSREIPSKRRVYFVSIFAQVKWLHPHVSTSCLFSARVYFSCLFLIFRVYFLFPCLFL